MPDPTSSTRDSQRRQATVVFADISGFTAMSEKLDPEDVTVIMNGCFEMLERIVRSHGGTIDKYIGDCVMALFGAEHAIENSAAQAVRASLEIRTALESFNRERSLPVPLRVHIGVNTGLVIAGEVGGEVKRDFTVMGDTVNLAARLEDASEKGQIFVGPETYLYTREAFEYRKLAPLALKGKSEAVQAYEVLTAKRRSDLPRLGAATRQVAAALVGRERELASLRSCVDALLRGEGCLVELSGDAGLGKSRLLFELSRMESLGSASILSGRSQSIGARDSYHAFAEMLAAWAGIKDEDPESETLDKLAAAIGALPATDAEELLPFVAVLMGIPLSGERAARVRGIAGDAMEKLITKAMSDLLVGLSSERPLVLCFEDLHWADLTSVRLLESLLHLATVRPILFLLAFRLGFENTSGRIAAVARERYPAHAVEIELAPLSQGQSQELVRRLLRIDALSHATHALIVRKSEGNPFFIEEVIRSLIDRGAIEMIEGGLRVTERVGSISIPGTIQEVITVRVEQLDREARQLLEIAAVVGRSFYHRIVAALMPERVDLEAAVDSLKERQVIHERQVRRNAALDGAADSSEREYVFQHALIQETIYESLLKDTRRQLHRRVAEAIEGVFADRLSDFYGMLAFHHGRGGDLARSEPYLLLAGEEAEKAAASSEALAYFREAYRIYPAVHGDGGDPALRARIEKSLANALLLTGNLAESMPYFDRALESLGEKRAYRNKPQAYLHLATDLARIFSRVYLRGGRMSRRPSTPAERERMGMLYNRARAQSVDDPERFLFDQMRMTGLVTSVDPSTVDQAFALYAGASLLFAYSGLSFRVSRRFRRVAESLLRDDRVNDLFTYHLMNFMTDYFEGAWQNPCGIDDELIERVMRTGQLWDVDTFLGMDFRKQLDLGRGAAAVHRQKQRDRLIDEYGYDFARTGRDAMVAFLALAERRLDAAVEAADVYLEHPVGMLNLLGLGTKAKAQLLMGAIDEAGETLDRADRLLAQTGRVTPFHDADRSTTRLLHTNSVLERALQTGDREGSRRLIRRGRYDARKALSTSARAARVRTETYRLVGTFEWLRGRERRGAAWWLKSIAEGERLGARPELARTHREVARRLAAAPGGVVDVAGGGSDVHLAAAKKLFRELELTAELAELEPIAGVMGRAG